MCAQPLRDSSLCAVTSAQFTTRHIRDLAAGRCPAVRVPAFMSRATCDLILDALEAAPFEAYGRQRVQPMVMRFGVGVSDHRREGTVQDSYWPAIEASNSAWRDLALPFDPFQECRDALAANWPGSVAVGRRGGIPMGAGVAREANQGFRVHFDDASREFAGQLLDAPLVAQFAFNLYLTVPRTGGETVIWRHRWQPTDEKCRLPNSYGFSEDVVEGAEFLELKPDIGEALLLDSRNYHAVRPSVDERRIALGFSVGLTEAGDLWTWG